MPAVFVPIPLTPSTSSSVGGKRAKELLELVGRSGCDQLLDDAPDRLSDSGQLEMFARGDQIGERRSVLDRSGRPFVGACTYRKILPPAP